MKLPHNAQWGDFCVYRDFLLDTNPIHPAISVISRFGPKFFPLWIDNPEALDFRGFPHQDKSITLIYSVVPSTIPNRYWVITNENLAVKLYNITWVKWFDKRPIKKAEEITAFDHAFVWSNEDIFWLDMLKSL